MHTSLCASSDLTAQGRKFQNHRPAHICLYYFIIISFMPAFSCYLWICLSIFHPIVWFCCCFLFTFHFTTAQGAVDTVWWSRATTPMLTHEWSPFFTRGRQDTVQFAHLFSSVLNFVLCLVMVLISFSVSRSFCEGCCLILFVVTATERWCLCANSCVCHWLSKHLHYQRESNVLVIQSARDMDSLEPLLLQLLRICASRLRHI